MDYLILLTANFFQNHIKSKYLPWWIKSCKIWLQCQPFEPEGCSSEGWVCTGTFLFFLGLSATEIKCTDHVALPKRPINEFKLDHQRRQQTLRAYCPNVFILCIISNIIFTLLTCISKKLYPSYVSQEYWRRIRE